MEESPALQTPEQPPLPAPESSPTYHQDLWGGLVHYTCVLDGAQFWLLPSFQQHMDRKHEGVMIAGAPGPSPDTSPPPPLGAAPAPEGSTPEALAQESGAPPAPAQEGVS